MAIVVGLIALAVACWVLRKRLPPYEHPLRWTADALPREAARALAQASPLPFLSTQLLEKVVLLGLTCVIFSQFLPGVDATPLAVVVSVAVVVAANTVLSTLLAQRVGREARSGVVQLRRARRAQPGAGRVPQLRSSGWTSTTPAPPSSSPI